MSIPLSDEPGQHLSARYDVFMSWYKTLYGKPPDEIGEEKYHSFVCVCIVASKWQSSTIGIFPLCMVMSTSSSRFAKRLDFEVEYGILGFIFLSLRL